MARIDRRYQTPIGELPAMKPLNLGSLTPGTSAQAATPHFSHSPPSAMNYRSPRKQHAIQAGTPGAFLQSRSPLRYASPPSRQSVVGPIQAMSPSASSPRIEPYGLPQHATFQFSAAQSPEVGSVRAPLSFPVAQPTTRRGFGSGALPHAGLASNLGTRRSLTSTPGVSTAKRGSFTSTPGIAAEMRGSFASTLGVAAEMRGSFASGPGVSTEARRARQGLSAEIPTASPLPEAAMRCPRSPAEASNTRSTQSSRAKAIRSDDTAKALSTTSKAPSPRSVFVGSPRSPRGHQLPQTVSTRSDRALAVVGSRHKLDVLPTALEANGHSPASREAASSRGEEVSTTTERRVGEISQAMTVVLVEDIRPGSVCIPVPSSGRINPNSIGSATSATHGGAKPPSSASADRLPASPLTAMIVEESKPVAVSSSHRESENLRICVTSMIVEDTPAFSASDRGVDLVVNPENGTISDKSDVGTSCAYRRGVSFAEEVSVLTPRSTSQGSDLSDRYPQITASTSTAAQFDDASPLFRGERSTSPRIPPIPTRDITKSTATAMLFSSDESLSPRRGLSESTIAVQFEEQRRDFSESTIAIGDFTGNERRELSDSTIAIQSVDLNEHQRSRRSSRSDSSVAETVPSSTETYVLSGQDRVEEEFGNNSARVIETAAGTTAAEKETAEEATTGKARVASGGIDGKWSKASISGTVLTWNCGSRHQIEIVDGGKFIMKWNQIPECLPTCSCFPAKIYTAVLEDDGKLHWSDGDIWARKAEENDL